MNYTKGEWRIVWNGYDYLIITDGGIDYILIAKSESKANAQLIASAPDLYEALKRATEKLENEDRTYEETIWICNQALAKAEVK